MVSRRMRGLPQSMSRPSLRGSGRGCRPRGRRRSDRSARRGRRARLLRVLAQPAQPAAQGADQRVQPHRLGDVVVHADRHAFFAVSGHGIGGQGDDGQSPPRRWRHQGAQGAGGLEPVHDGHLAIHQHQIERLREGALKGLGPVAGYRDLDAQSAQHPDGYPLIDRVVLCEEDTSFEPLAGCRADPAPLRRVGPVQGSFWVAAGILCLGVVHA